MISPLHSHMHTAQSSNHESQNVVENYLDYDMYKANLYQPQTLFHIIQISAGDGTPSWKEPLATNVQKIQYIGQTFYKKYREYKNSTSSGAD